MEKKKVDQSGFLEAPFVRMLRMRSASLKICFYVSKTVKDLLFDKCPEKHDIINK